MLFTVIVLVLMVALYFYSTRNFDYWKNKGVKYEKPLPIIGNYAKIYSLRKNVPQFLAEIYDKYPNEKVVGLFKGNNPELMIRDPEIIKRVLITDFGKFHLRRVLPKGAVIDEKEVLFNSLVTLNGDKWKLLRQRLTSAFTSGKLKAMFPLITERAERLYTRIQGSTGVPIDARDLLARFTTDFIGACGFGLDMDALSDEDSEFRKIGQNLLSIDPIETIKLFLRQLTPKLFDQFKLTERFAPLRQLVRSILTQRNYEPIGRHDFVDLLLECKKKGTIVGESIERFASDGTPEKATLELTENLIAAQMSVFFIAGFETSSSTSSFTLHQLAFYPDKQKKVQEEIDRVLLKYDNKLCYDAVKDMHYLEWAFKESMRKYPAIGFLMRDCAHKCVIPELNLTIDEGVKMLIPSWSLQNDTQYYENPEEFRPERFNPEEMDVNTTKFTYLPFGEGPRNCIGERLGQMQALAGLAAVLSKFTVEPHSTTLRHPIFECKPFLVQTLKGGIPLVFRERKKEQ